MKALGKKSIASVLKVWLAVMWWLAWVAVGVIAIAFTWSMFTGNPADSFMDVPVEFQLDEGAYQVESKHLDVSAASITDVSGMLRFTSASRPLMLIYAVFALLYAGVLLFVIRQLRKLFQSLVDGVPFTIENASRIRLIGLIVLAGEVVESFLVFVGQLYIDSRFEITGLTVDPGIDIDLSTVFAGLVLLVIAEVFRIGTQLKEDQDLTV